MKCCTLPDGAEQTGGHKKKGGHHRKSNTPFAKAARSCTGKTGQAFWKCVNRKLKK